MKKVRAYHPLRQLMMGGNPNKANKPKNKNVAPLVEYLVSHKIDPETFNQLVQNINGQVVTPFDASYNTGRLESDNAFNKYPLFIIYCNCSADVSIAVKFCRSENLPICLRAGGHNTAGYSVLDGRVLIDVANIKGIFVDPINMTSTVGSGVTWGEYNHELNAYGLHNPGGSCDTVGMAGYTMGGGYGYTSMKWGIACDNLIEIRMVTAEGEMVTANEHINPDLLWAHKGGTGGNFGVLVSMKYKLYKLKNVWPIQVNWPIEDAAEVLFTWQNTMTKTLKDRNLGLLGFLAIKEISKIDKNGIHYTINQPYFCIRGIYSDDNSTAGKKALEPLLKIGKPTYPAGTLWKKQITYSMANQHLLDNVEGIIPDDIKETKRCAYIEKALKKEDYQKMVDYFKTSPNPYNIVSMEPYGGAINEIKSDASAFVHRNAYFDVFTDSFWMTDNEKDEAFSWLRNYYESESMKSLWSNHYYQNYVNDEYKNWQFGYFGENYPELQLIKRKWDPENIFNFPQSIEI
ncbi:hypothetical protein AD998_21725 [bacterium 336/3]|nr:hypothetical protein AD998_21725 [bacterium 336/3]